MQQIKGIQEISEISEKFKKPKSVISEIIQIKNIDENLVRLFKEKSRFLHEK